MKKRTDIYNRVWNLPLRELCPTCGQPDNDGTCNHKKLKNKDVIALGGILPEKPFKFNIKIHQEAISHDRIKSFWYDNLVASIKVPEGTYYLEANGDIQVMFKPNSDWYKNSHAVKEALYRNITDKKLNKIYEHDGWSYNNWFEVVFVENDTNSFFSDMGDIADDYEEGMRMLKICAEERWYVCEPDGPKPLDIR